MSGKSNTEYSSVIFDELSALDTVQNLDFIRVCGSEGERRAMDIVTRRLDEIGVDWHYHAFGDRWLEPHDPHLLVGGRKIAVRPAMELSYQHGADLARNEELSVDLRAQLAPIGHCNGKIAVCEHFDRDRPIAPGSAAQLMAFPFEHEMEPYLWIQQERDRQRIPSAIVMREDIPFVLRAIGEPAALKWSARAVEREFRNLVAEITGTQRPDEIVVMGAHIDSWPGTVGACDDATGCAILVEAARWFAGHPPATTVRLLWFTGEEVDARGSRTYVRDCLGNPRTVKLMVNVDSTCEIDSGVFQIYTSDESTYDWACRRLNLKGMEHFVTEASGTDAGAFIACGIPALSAEAPYSESACLGHLPDDRPESIDLHKLQVLGSLSLQAVQAACGWAE